MENKELIIYDDIPFHTLLTVIIVSKSPKQAQNTNERGDFIVQIAVLSETLRIIVFLLLSMLFSFPSLSLLSVSSPSFYFLIFPSFPVSVFPTPSFLSPAFLSLLLSQPSLLPYCQNRHYVSNLH